MNIHFSTLETAAKVRERDALASALRLQREKCGRNLKQEFLFSG